SHLSNPSSLPCPHPLCCAIRSLSLSLLFSRSFSHAFIFIFRSRPDTSFMWFMNPWKTLRYVVWRNFKGTILSGLLILFVAFFLLLFVYSLPGQTVKSIFDKL